jgi:hypothetical protein
MTGGTTNATRHAPPNTLSSQPTAKIAMAEPTV